MNKSQKEKLVHETVTERFKSQRELLKERRFLLAAALVLHEAGPVPDVDPKWLAVKSTITVAGVEGLQSDWRYRNSADYEPLLSMDFTLRPAMPVTQAIRATGKVTAEGLHLKKFNKFVDDVLTLRDKETKLRTDLEALLAPVRTYNQLLKVWPEGEELYKKYAPAPKTTALADPSLVTRLNATLGVPSEKV